LSNLIKPRLNSFAFTHQPYNNQLPFPPSPILSSPQNLRKLSDHLKTISLASVDLSQLLTHHQNIFSHYLPNCSKSQQQIFSINLLTSCTESEAIHPFGKGLKFKLAIVCG
jgi:hypothetical protein